LRNQCRREHLSLEKKVQFLGIQIDKKNTRGRKRREGKRALRAGGLE